MRITESQIRKIVRKVIRESVLKEQQLRPSPKDIERFFDRISDSIPSYDDAPVELTYDEILNLPYAPPGLTKEDLDNFIHYMPDSMMYYIQHEIGDKICFYDPMSL